MTWTQLRERLAVMAELSERAAGNAADALGFLKGWISDVERLFGDDEGLLLSMQQRWAAMLTATLAQALAELRADQRGLRAVLDGGVGRGLIGPPC